MLNVVSPAWVMGALVVLAFACLSYALWPYHRRAFLPVLALTALGVMLGQAWAWLGLPALRFGEFDLLPGIAFAVALQPLVDRLPLRFG